MAKWLKLGIAILLLPFCVGAGWALWLVCAANGNAEKVWVAILAGAGCWLMIFWMLPTPMLLYVFGHELTHVVWTWLMGGSVRKFKASASGGQVVVTKNNFLVALAPYFFPLYAVILITVFAVLRCFWDVAPYAMWFHLLLGASYAFHVTLTWHVLQTRQSDITDQGYLFSFVVIFLGNVLILLIAIPLLASGGGVWKAFGLWGERSLFVLKWLWLKLP